MSYVGTDEAEFAFYGEPQHETRSSTDPERLRVVDVTLPPERALYQRPHYPRADQTSTFTVEPLLRETETESVRITKRQ